MGEVNFSYKELSEKPSSTADKVKEIENKKEIAEFENEVATWEAYAKIGAAEFLGDLTEKGMSDLFKKEENIKNIRYELIPEQLVEENGAEYKVYRITENYDPDSTTVQEITRNEYNCYVDVQEKTAEQYDSLVESGKMDSLGALTREEIAKHKEENNVPNENIKEVPCFDDKGNLIDGSRCYYKITG